MTTPPHAPRRDTVRCPHCQSDDIVPVKNRPHHACRVCRKQFSTRVGTEEERSHLSPEQWEKAREVVRACGTKADIMRALDVPYKTALRVYERLRWMRVGVDGLTKSERAQRKRRAAGLCECCGQPCAPYQHCEKRRKYKSAMAMMKRYTEKPPTNRSWMRVGIGAKRRHGHKAELPATVKVTCPACRVVWERPLKPGFTRTRCPSCWSAYLKDYKAKRKQGWTPERRPCELCGEPLSPLSKRNTHPACSWWKMRTEHWEEQERTRRWQLEQMERPTTEQGWMLKARRELRRAQSAARQALDSQRTSRPPAISLTS